MPRKALLINVGGTPAPIAYSIDCHRPEKVLFFASQSSRSEIETKVRPLTGHRWLDQEVLTAPDHQDLTKCIEVLTKDLPSRLALLGLDWKDLVVDYTGGTKTMSAAVVLATINRPVAYSYIGGRVRTKEGLGTVLDGSEALVFSPNPWDVLAVDLRRRIARQFNRGHFAEAAQSAQEALERVGGELRPMYEGFVHLCTGYEQWQRFDYGRASRTLPRALAGLRPLAAVSGDRPLVDFLEQVETEGERLEHIARAFKATARGDVPAAEDANALVLDLVVNAERVTRLGGRPDDGIARLYSALEKLAKVGLGLRGINNSKALPDEIPEALRAEYQGKYMNPENGRLQFGLSPSYALLAALDDPVGAHFMARSADLEKVLKARNSSLMVHGWNPIKEDDYERMLGVCLDFMELGTKDLPQLPCFPA
jgi:CRISPR-associated protein (TIGR02710 family)